MQIYYLFGREQAWAAKDWTASDDRVRGGSSQSYLEVEQQAGHFYGTLDTETLGGAGFASQRTHDNRSWNLSAYDGLRIAYGRADGKKYTLVLKDTLLDANADTGREQASISYEFDLETSVCQTQTNRDSTHVIDVRWSDLKPTYRGRDKPDTKPLDTSDVKQFSIMMRSFFDEQRGPFTVHIESIAAVMM